MFQHEMDHLDGVLLIERLNADQRREAKQILRQRNLELSTSDPDGLHQLLGE
ncbi:MAG TPA: peptide deformylase [Acidimicrobiales bacterium]